MKLFRTTNIDIINYRRAEVKIWICLSGTLIEQCTSIFRNNYRSPDNLYCKMLCANLMLCVYCKINVYGIIFIKYSENILRMTL